MDWETWPTGRPGPFVSEARMQEVIGIFQRCEQERNEQSPTNENIMHIAEFSLSGRGESEFLTRHPNNNLFRNICWTHHGTGAGDSAESEH